MNFPYDNSDRIGELHWGGLTGGLYKCVLRWSEVVVSESVVDHLLPFELVSARSGGAVLGEDSWQRSCRILDSRRPDSCDEGSGTDVG